MKQNKKIILSLILSFLFIVLIGIITLSNTKIREEKGNLKERQSSTQDSKIEQELTICELESNVEKDETTTKNEVNSYVLETTEEKNITEISSTKVSNTNNKSIDFKEETTELYILELENESNNSITIEKDTTTQEVTTVIHKNQITEETTVPIIEEVTTTEEITLPSIEEETTNKLEYDDVVLALNDKISQKGYRDELKKIIRNILSSLSKNYDSYLDLYKFAGLPSKEEYIMEHLVYALDDVKDFELYDYNSDIGQELINDNYSSIGWINPLYLNIGFIYNIPYNEENEDELLFHEISHAKNKECFAFINEPEEYILYRYDIFIEGHATFNQQFTNNLFERIEGAWYVSNSIGNTIMYMKNNCLGYLQYYNVYSNLLLLAGYDTMEEVSKTADLNILKMDLQEKYGTDIADKIFDCMNYITYTDIDKDLRYDKCIEFQNLVIDALCIQLEGLQSREELEDYLEFYKLYQNFILPKVYETDDRYNSKEITYEVFNLAKLESIIINKCIEHEVIAGEYDTSTKIAILKVILFYKDKKYGNINNLNYTFINLPSSYKDVQINSVFSSNGGYYINIGYEEKLYDFKYISRLYVDMSYVLDEKFNVIDVYNTNYKYIYDN